MESYTRSQCMLYEICTIRYYIPRGLKRAYIVLHNDVLLVYLDLVMSRYLLATNAVVPTDTAVGEHASVYEFAVSAIM
ncbi:hypothetical protein AC249_AIPGENE24652 [Exaiptasia diaphana]|nr:hypothetical protein AC249_AIPGENE24652 [Exaiptasia diaphana]